MLKTETRTTFMFYLTLNLTFLETLPKIFPLIFLTLSPHNKKLLILSLIKIPPLNVKLVTFLYIKWQPLK
jgi:hypothetical protein